MKIRLPSQVATRAASVAFGRTTFVIALALGAAACQKAPPPEAPKGPALESEVAKASYGLGYNIAGNVNNQYGNALDSKAFQAGIEDGFAGAKAKVPEEQVLAALNALNDARAEERTKTAETNLAAAKAYLEANGKKEGVVTTTSGLQYQILVAGTGPKPSITDTVTTHYTGHVDRRHRVRQFGRTRRARVVPGQRCDPGLGRSVAVDVGRVRSGGSWFRPISPTRNAAPAIASARTKR